MSKRPKVNRTYYKKLSQSALSVFALATVNNTKGVSAYKSLAGTVTELEDKATAYAAALQAAELGGRDRVLTKNFAKEEVLHAMDELSNGMDFFCKGSIEFFTKSGLPVQNGAVQHTGELLPPVKFSATATGLPGVVELRYKIDANQRSSVNSIGVEWSIDNGVTWQNGKYGSTKSKMTLTGMPSRQLVLIKIRCLGTRNRVSEWSAEVAVSVA